jgi:hypothetical protein
MASNEQLRVEAVGRSARGLRSPRARRALPWIAALVLAAGVIAFLAAYIPNTGKSNATPFDLTKKPQLTSKTPQKTPLSKEARRVAGRFIQTAVVRKNLDEAWRLSGPDLKQGLTLAQWRTGDIPVVPFPQVDLASLKVDFSYPRYALIEVVLLPKKSVKVKGQIFFMEMRKFGQGSAAHWLVTSWVPRAAIAVPATMNN